MRRLLLILQNTCNKIHNIDRFILNYIVSRRNKEESKTYRELKQTIKKMIYVIT